MIRLKQRAECREQAFHVPAVVSLSVGVPSYLSDSPQRERHLGEGYVGGPPGAAGPGARGEPRALATIASSLRASPFLDRRLLQPQRVLGKRQAAAGSSVVGTPALGATAAASAALALGNFVVASTMATTSGGRHYGCCP